MGRYLKFADQARQLNESLGLSHYEIQLLDLTAKAHFLEKPIFVGDLTYQRHIASQATLHASVKNSSSKSCCAYSHMKEVGALKRLD